MRLSKNKSPFGELRQGASAPASPMSRGNNILAFLALAPAITTIVGGKPRCVAVGRHLRNRQCIRSKSGFGIKGMKTSFQTDAPINRGNSGKPLLSLQRSRSPRRAPAFAAERPQAFVLSLLRRRSRRECKRARPNDMLPQCFEHRCLVIA
jgi:hypothetical protein